MGFFESKRLRTAKIESKQDNACINRLTNTLIHMCAGWDEINSQNVAHEY